MCCLGRFNRLTIWHFLVTYCGFDCITFRDSIQDWLPGTRFNTTRDRSVNEYDHHVQVWNPTTIGLENWTQWCMADLNLIPHFKYTTILCFKNRDIFSMYVPTWYISVHENGQHVQFWNPITNFFKNHKNHLISKI